MKRFILKGDLVNVWLGLPADIEYSVIVTGVPDEDGCTFAFERDDGTWFESTHIVKMEHAKKVSE
jgi:hypothetical protein